MKKGLLLSTFVKVRWLQKWSSRQQLEAYQEKAVSKQLSYMKKHSPYYSRCKEEPLPLMDKEKMMRHFDELNTVGVKKEQAFEIALQGERTRDFQEDYQGISVGLSSGTSGNRGIFLTSETEQAIWAGTILARMLPKEKLLNHRLAFFLRADNQLYQTIQSKAIQLAYFDMYQPFEEHLARLNHYQPTILIAPPSVLLRLAQAMKEKHLAIHPTRIISVAEILETCDEEYLKESFSLSVIHQIYQCTEGFLGCTCEHGTLHLNEDIVKFEKEYIDEKRFYPIITDFKRTSQPMLRYRLNDILIAADQPCACGSVFEAIEKIEGREDDIFIFNGLKQKEVAVYPDFIRRCLLFVSEVRDYQVIQTASNQLIIKVEGVSETTQQKIIQEFAKLAADQEFEQPLIRFQPYEQEQEKKMKRIQRIVE
ncbi:F390 synthetase-related protein [Enterococcus sp. BWR-S5]|uniref:F390 synthetase-related protein n=1 Tax=Enterococcus sp. BWR-S5 TaxID=2787714 RepID=UPI0019227822|nr:F390 synthetase-related protein [Enterococcus sp. BWR-S5]MBL1226366.1 CoF synthetase [Enterococcus sp. BWR-S5]